jgi:AcrR family transcriptional regulator
MKTKDKILSEALKQFNKLGVEVITTRHIAKALEISQGNLHYHFPNKEVIITELYQAFISKVQAARKYRPDTIFKKENVLLSMQENFKIMHTYRFLFRDNETVWRRVPELKKQMLELLSLKQTEIKEIISIYIEQGVFREDISNKQIDYLAQQFIFNISTWLNAADYLGIKKNKAAYFAELAFRQWLPYLQPKEMNEWEGLLTA